MLDSAAPVAVGAGMLAALNPCGFALLPAYLTLLVTGDQPNRVVAVGRALKLTASMTAGFLAVFAAFGFVIAPVASSAQRYLPWVTVVVGLLLLAAGAWLLTGRPLPGLRARFGSGPITGSVRSMFGFGLSYAAASLTCTIAPFLAVVVSAFRTDSVWAGATLFALYAAGMGLVVGTAALAVALARQSVVSRARRLGRLVPVAGAVLLVAVGAYVAYYGWWEIQVLRGEPAADPVIDAASALQQGLANAVASFGFTGFLVTFAIILAAFVATTVARPLARLRRPAQEASEPATQGSEDSSDVDHGR
ncbi:MAG TPA: cytochrome c biogenesis CcdA family protein [Nocardioidaceae bacterium]|nr:cytochrome c biogenesis CcdA family protein [Nocardioidaceae bacterium]